MLLLLTAGVFAETATLAFQPTPKGQQAQAAPPAVAQRPDAETPPVAERLVNPVPRDRWADLSFSNRHIITFRASIVPRDPEGRAESAAYLLARLAERNITGPVTFRTLLGASVVVVAGRDVFAIVPADVDPATDEDLQQLTDASVERLRVAMAEAYELRAPRRLAIEVANALVATLLLAVALIMLARTNHWAARRLGEAAHARLSRSMVGSDPALIRGARVIEASGWVARVCAATLGIILIYSWLTFVLQQFPIARPWGEVLGAFLVRTLAQLGWGLLSSLPGLFTVVVIFLITRFAVRLAASLFDALEQRRIEIKGLTGAKAVPTRRITTTLLWLFAIVVAYPYLPGSGTDAFKGVSVFVGLVVSLGSSGIVNQLMSGFMLIYSGALSPGDVVRIGDVEGKVTNLGVFTTKLKDFRNQEISIPNNVVMSGTAVNWTRYAPEGVMQGTSVTIGYDTPWRQVQAMLLQAADRTPGLSRSRPPYVMQTSLSDFYVEYTLMVCVEDPMQRIPTFAVLHANIQDVFNEYGVQIMSPHYLGDPAGAKVVPADKWFPPPARPTGAGV